MWSTETEARRKAQYKYNHQAAQIKRRASRNKARRAMIKAGKARKGDGKDIGHRNGNPLDDRMSNYKVQTKRSNRSYPRTKGAHKKNKRD